MLDAKQVYKIDCSKPVPLSNPELLTQYQPAASNLQDCIHHAGRKKSRQNCLSNVMSFEQAFIDYEPVAPNKCI
jgi:hypothetical protein